MSRWLSILFIGIAAVASHGLYAGWITVPDRFNPWAPLDVMATPNALTGYKLTRTRGDPAACREALAHTGMRYETVPDRVTGPGCGFDNAVRLLAANVRLGSPVLLSCPMALSFFMWERHALQPAAQKNFGQPVAAIEHLGSYACRNVNRGDGAASESDGPLQSRSRHATANALDIAAFTLADGRRISVEKFWQRSAPVTVPGPEAQLLAQSHQDACRFFDGVLGPNYNAVHSDHLHLETGGYRMCR